MVQDGLDRQLEKMAALRDPLRRSLYRYVCSQGREVGRDEAAAALGTTRGRVAAQLDTLAEVGLLEVTFRRLNERRGPGAGRPAKLYRQAAEELDVSIPPRRYALVADVLAGAIVNGGTDQAAIDESAREVGRRLGERRRGAAGARPSSRRLASAIEAFADECGFEPVRSDRRVALANCPFRALVESRGELVCKMNLALFQGALIGVGANPGCATRRSRPRGCCVTIDLSSRPPSASRR